MNSCLSNDPDLLSSAILNFFAIEEIPLPPLFANFSLKLSRSYYSVAFCGTPASVSYFTGLLKMLLVCYPLPYGAYPVLPPAASSDFQPLVPIPFLDSSVSFQAFSIIS